jgi:hypothetical protein
VVVFQYIKKGKLLEQGINLYKQKSYVEALSFFHKAESIDKNDFSVNYWLARAQIMNGDYVAAKKLLDVCRKLKPKVIDLLIVPWEDLIHNLETDKKAFFEKQHQCDIDADKNIYKCYFRNIYSFKEVISFYFINILVDYLLYLYVPEQLDVIALLIQLSYLHFSTLLPLNMWIRYCWIKKQIKNLFRSSSFLLFLAGFIIISLIIVDGLFFYRINLSHIEISMVHELINEYYKRSSCFMLFHIVLVGPIKWQLLYSLVWYNYLAKHNRIIGYVGVFLLLLIYGDLAPAFMSFFCILAYNKYNTILAPIVLSCVKGFFLIIQPLILQVWFAYL